MRLIDADEFKEIIVTYGNAGFAQLRINKICEIIDGQTTAYDADKVAEQIDGIMKDESILFVNQAVNRAKRIVKYGGINL